MKRIRILSAFATSPLIAATTFVASAAAAPATFHPPIAALNANQSNNWSGYNQGQLEKGTAFHSVAGDWIVPKATAHKAKEAEYSATWTGIGGGCIDANCVLTDSTLIQAGTEQDVDSSGRASYSAWWETIPAPAIDVSLPVTAGNHIHVAITEGAPQVWTITIANLTTGQSFSATVPYSSSYTTAEWIEETPVVVGSSGAQVGPLPNLSTVGFDLSTTNGTNAALVSSEQMQLVDFNGAVLATPSAPDPDTDGFNDCSYATACAAPSSS